MSRFLVWFRWEWRDHWKLVVGCALGAVFITWVALLLGRSGMGRDELEGVLVGELAVVGLLLAAGLFGSERRHGAEALLLRTPGARLPLFLARLAFFVTGMGATAAVAAFGAARLAQMESGRASLQPPELGWFLWPSFTAADLLVLALALAALGLLASAWTRRGTVAFVLGLILLAVVLFPWIYLGASRGDFFPFFRLGAIPLAAWPLIGLAVAALALSWFAGRHYMNRPWRAVGYGVVVLVAGIGLAGFWTAQALADFDDVRADAPGFRVASYVVGPYIPPHVNNAGHTRFLPLDCVALAPDGNTVWLQGYRHDVGKWPNPVNGHVRDFRKDRGTWSRQWRIDLKTGAAHSVGDVREKLVWTDLGSGKHRGLLRGVDRAGSMGTRAFALLGRPGNAEDERVVDLTSGAVYTGAKARERVRNVAASGTGVRDGEGRPAWLEFELDSEATNNTGVPVAGRRRLLVVTSAGRTPIEDEALVRPRHNLLDVPAGLNSLAIPGGWAYVDDMDFVTIEAATGRVRRRSNDPALESYRTSQFYLDTRHVLAVTERGRESNGPWGYILLDLESDVLGPKLTAPAWQFILPTATPERQLVCMARTEKGRAFVLWTPQTDERTPLTIEGGSKVFPEECYPQLYGADVRGNMVFGVVTYAVAGSYSLDTFFYRAKTRQLFLLGAQPSMRGRAAAFHAIGIDDQDRVVGLGEHDGNGYRSIVRFDPADGSKTVVFPKK